MEEKILKVKEASKHFGGVYAIKGVNVDINHGGIWGLVGPNGSGKSTLFKSILGLHNLDEGEVYFNGQLINNLPPHKLYDMGLVTSFQVPRLFHSMSVLDNMLVAARGHRGNKLLNSLFLKGQWEKQEAEYAEKAMALLETVELERLAFAPANELSGGQRKLLAIAQGLMTEPKLLLLDEPMAGINPVIGKSIFQKLHNFSRNGLTLFVVEHRLEILFEFASWVYVMDKGHIVTQGHPEQIVNEPGFYKAYLGEE